jgi:uncharacterized protein YyaL (SSP411 family)
MNRLARETSPYLRDHASQPVDWYPWGDEALARARAEDKPIFLSIGYSACHWCHVMARESFADAGIAARLNAGFIPIKVDREERPDLDEIYVEAVRLMTGSAGWPLSVFLTPELKPFYGGTYFPPVERHGLAGFGRVLDAVLHYFRTERHEVDSASNRVTAELVRLSTPPGHPGELSAEPLRRFYRQRLEAFDSDHGGFGIAPKFPGPTELALLLRLAGRPGFDQALPMVELTLRKMAEGGICDQLGGGFHRYSTDTIWLVPHFEKMLYDNALLAPVYARAWLVTDEEFYRSVAQETLAYLTRELAHPAGGFCAAQDADTAGTEGGHYTWAPAQLEAAVGADLAPLAADYYGISAPGNYAGTNVLHTAVPVEQLLRRHRLDLPALWDRLAEIRAKLLAARQARPALRRDEKVLADWNGLALSAFAFCGRAFGDGRLLEQARALARHLTGPMMPGGELQHQLRPGQADIAGQLSDYAFVAQGLVDLYDAEYDPAHLAAAVGLADRLTALFAVDGGGFCTARAEAAGLICRISSGADGAIPSGNSVAIAVLLRLARLCGRDDFERSAVAALRRFYPLLEHYPSAFGQMTAALDLLLHPGPEVALFLPGASAEGTAMLELLGRHPDEARATAVIRAAEPDPALARLIPLTNGRTSRRQLPTAYVCRNLACSEPATTAAALAQLLALPQDSDRSQLDSEAPGR